MHTKAIYRVKSILLGLQKKYSKGGDFFLLHGDSNKIKQKTSQNCKKKRTKKIFF